MIILNKGRTSIKIALFLLTVLACSISNASSSIYRFEDLGGGYLELALDFSTDQNPPDDITDGLIVDDFDEFYEATLIGDGGGVYFFLGVALFSTNINPCDIVIDPDVACTLPNGPGYAVTMVVANDPGMVTSLIVAEFLSFNTTPLYPIEAAYFPTNWEPGILIENFASGYSMELLSIRAVPLPATLPLLSGAFFVLVSARRVKSC